MGKVVRVGLGISAILALHVLTIAGAEATTFFPQDFTCPIGGEKFKAQVVGSNSTFGARPDGMPYSPLPIYPLIECPKNGFILFDESYRPEEIAQLQTAIASPEFQTMRKSETPHYRAWWLMRAVGRDSFRLASTLLEASWEADPDPALKARYQAAFAEAASTLPRQAGKEQYWFWLNLRTANVLRELGRFDEARAALERLDKAEFLPRETEELAAARHLIDGLLALIAEGNRVSEPANLIPRFPAQQRCQQTGLTASEIIVCNALEVSDTTQSSGSPKLVSSGKNESSAITAAEAAAKEAARDAAAAATSTMSKSKTKKRIP